MHPYETLLVLRADLAEPQRRGIGERATQVIERMGGTVRGVHEWGVRDLAYPIEKERRGYYTLFEYTAGPEVVRELERALKLADEVLRSVTVRQKPMPRKTKTKRQAPPAPEPAAETATDESSTESNIG